VPDSTDRELLFRCLDGDPRAWESLVDRHGPLVRAVAFAVTRDPDQADDVYLETFARLLENLGRLRQPSRLRSWLVTTSRRLAIDAGRRQARRVDLGEDILQIPDPGTPDTEELQRLEDRARVHRALEELGERCRRLLQRLYLEEERPSYRRIGRELGMPVGSIGPTRARCLQRLRAIYESQEDPR